jgi:hypothetical protein
MAINRNFYPVKDITGRMIDFGIVKQTRSWNAIDGAPPSWIDFGTPTPAPVYNDSTTGRPGVTLNLPTAGGTQRLMRSTPAILLNDLRAVWLQVSGIRSASTGGSFQLRLTPSAGSSHTVGCIAGLANPNGFMSIYHGATVPTQYLPGRLNKFTGLNIGMLLVKDTKQVYLTEGEDIVAYSDGSATLTAPNGSSIQAGINYYPGPDMHIMGFSVTTWYD